MNERDCVAQLVNTIRGEKTGRIIAVAGGSCTGKTTLIADMEKELGASLAVIHLDDYQRGSEWAGRATSVYGWDDPEHFSIPELATAIDLYRQGRDIEVPVFSLKENRRTGTRTVAHRDILLIEGLYVLPPYLPKSDTGIYIEAPFYIRLIRRIVRFLTEVQPQDRTIPLRHMIMNTYRAHADFLVKEKPQADYTVGSTFSYDTVHSLLMKLPPQTVEQGRENTIGSFFDGRLKMTVVETGSTSYFSITDSGTVVYKVPMAKEWIKPLLSVDMMSV